jgi:hypothetical protein
MPIIIYKVFPSRISFDEFRNLGDANSLDHDILKLLRPSCQSFVKRFRAEYKLAEEDTVA